MGGEAVAPPITQKRKEGRQRTRKERKAFRNQRAVIRGRAFQNPLMRYTESIAVGPRRFCHSGRASQTTCLVAGFAMVLLWASQTTCFFAGFATDQQPGHRFSCFAGLPQGDDVPQRFGFAPGFRGGSVAEPISGVCRQGIVLCAVALSPSFMS